MTEKGAEEQVLAMERLRVRNVVTGVYLAEPIADTIAVCTTSLMFYAYYEN